MGTAHDLFIRHEWRKGSGLKFFSIDPGNGNAVWQGHAASQEDIDDAVEAAREAFKEWSSLGFEERLRYLERFEGVLVREKENLINVISRETGKPLWDSANEAGAMANKLGFAVDGYRVRCPEVTRKFPAASLVTRHRPHGVVGVFGPFNFPAHLPTGHIIPALLAGNTVIFKPSELTPGVGAFLAHLWEQSHLPKGVFNLVQGGGSAGQMLAGHHGIDGLFFTGSYKTGRLLTELFAKNPGKILALETGGNNPLVVGRLTNYAAAAYLTIQSAYLTSGQRCTCARRLIVPEGEGGDRFVDALVEMTKRIVVGHYTAVPQPFMGPVIREAAAHRFLTAQDDLIANGGRSLVKMTLLKEGTSLLSPGLIDVTSVENRSDEEIFAPFLQLIRVKNLDEAIAEANNTSYGLAAGFLGDNNDEYAKFYRDIRAGVVSRNMPLTGASGAAPFGG